jgi:DNA repair exonuclease SbcCD ATPase subunit
MSIRDEFYDTILPDFHDKMVELKLVDQNIEYLQSCIVDYEEMIEAGKKARIVFQEVAQLTQKNLEEHISNLVTLALKAVSPSFPNFIAEMAIKRNQLECNFSFETNGNKVPVMFSSGGGPKDVASFALVVSYWAMDKNRATIILDEPFRNVSPDLQANVGDMLRMISDKLELQLIMVSHADTINESADREFKVELIDEVSHIT